MQNKNAFLLIGQWRRTARRMGLSKQTIADKIQEATSGDYNHLCNVLK